MRRIALCIGNDNYTVLSQLSFAKANASAISDMLQRIGFETKLVTDLDREGLNNEIIGFCDSLSEYNVRLLYYAGHGFQ